MRGRLPVLGVLLSLPVSLLIAGPAVSQDGAALAQYAAAPMSAYKGKIAVNPDAAQPSKVIVSSVSAWQPNPNADTYLSATIDRSARTARYYAFQAQSVTGDWAGYNKAEFATPAGPVEVKATLKDDSIVTCEPEPCKLKEVARFPVDRATLDAAAKGADAKLVWLMKSSKGGADVAGMVSAGEISAFLAEVDAQLKRK